MAKPEYTIRYGSIQLSIWTNEGKEFNTQSITISRSYLDKDKKWQNTNSLRFQDLPLVALAIADAMRYKYLKKETSDF